MGLNVYEQTIIIQLDIGPQLFFEVSWNHIDCITVNVFPNTLYKKTVCLQIVHSCSCGKIKKFFVDKIKII